ncbi:hypothetical protein Cni_G12128 [Canna indica]|uniref:Pentatricopeptide repeat-containing protein n=1 Tax=Canna indica TaxID=4628 RepID=A0AAQ3K786_9LILI|nr:hypothetical protein Cni_G12128 [Canna indica]
MGVLLHKFLPRHKLLTLQCRIHTSTARAHLSSSTMDSHPSPPWTSTNHILQRHPRLLSLEAHPSLCHLQAILAFAIISGLFHNPFISSRLLVHATSFDLAFASQIFQRMRSMNIFSWNTIIRAAAVCENLQTSATFVLYTEMLQRGTLPDRYTFPFLLKACRSPSDLNYGKLVHCHALILGLNNDKFVQTALLTMYLSCGHLNNAHYLFNEITHRDVVVWTTMISGLADRCCHEEALEVFSEMRMCEQNVTPNEAMRTLHEVGDGISPVWIVESYSWPHYAEVPGANSQPDNHLVIHEEDQEAGLLVVFSHVIAILLQNSSSYATKVIPHTPRIEFVNCLLI